MNTFVFSVKFLNSLKRDIIMLMLAEMLLAVFMLGKVGMNVF